jgi:hypothetical protein
MRETISPIPQYAFMAWCLVKHRDKFTFYLLLSYVTPEIYALPTVIIAGFIVKDIFLQAVTEKKYGKSLSSGTCLNVRDTRTELTLRSMAIWRP